MRSWLMSSLISLFASLACASTITINNPSFETPSVGCSGPSCFVYSFSGWTVGAGAGFGVATFAPSVGAGQEFTSLPDGLQVAAISNGSGSGGEIYQDLSATLAANTVYSLTFWVGHRADVVFDSNYVVSLMARGVTLAYNTGASPAAGTFVNETILFNSGPSPVELGDSLRIDISAPLGSPGQADFDLFALSTSSAAVTPEPTTLLLVLGGFYFGGFRRLLSKRSATT